ncbi:MAG: cytochrome c oxidase subunit 3 [Candidatus Marinimicrobia bacterium]|nr:cytochrome c oxidase subunit 3 [Candidatus Neomarinimicrobiota bacterium]
MEQTLSMNKSFGDATTGKLGMWLFLVMDALTFGAILIGGIALRAASDGWPVAGTILNIPLTAFNTFLLICTSFTMVMALQGLREGSQKRFIRYLQFTIIGGMVFLGIQIYEYYHFISGSSKLGLALASGGFISNQFLPSTGMYGAVFYTTTSFHGLHVLSGVIYLSVIMFQGMKGMYSAENYDRVEIAALFWHFVDLIWILVFTIIYLL